MAVTSRIHSPDFLRRRDEYHVLLKDAAMLSESAFQRVWDNPDDADYDQL